VREWYERRWWIPVKRRKVVEKGSLAVWTLSDRILQVVFAGISSGAIYSLAGIAVAVVFNVTRIIDLSQGQYVMLGALLSCFFYSILGSIFVSAVLGLVFTLAVGTLIWRSILQTSSERYPHLTLILITLGIAMFIEGMAFIIFGTEMRFLPPFVDIGPICVSRARIAPQAPWLVGTLLVMVSGLALIFDRTLLGKALRACHEHLLAARLMGINPQKMTFFAYMLGVFLAAIAGIVMTPLLACNYSIGLLLTLKGLLVAIVGGITKFQGVLVGGLALGLLESITGGFISSDYMEAIPLGILLIALLFRPTGFLGPKELRSA
jgi:branched-chain amino acid transport system permease protein